ncbi:MAG: dUTP diphosphatase [Rhizobiaceae bacterium]|nr:dUTP diphosphatase [Rhizobiaceae bacterium]
MSRLKIKRLPHGEGLPLPAYETAGAAGMDLQAAVPETEPVVLAPRQRMLIPTGLTIELPHRHEGQVRPRSGLAIKHGISLINTPGTIDEDYRGEVKVPLVNHGEHDFEITRGMRIAQLVIAPVVQVLVEEVEELSSSDRGSGGFGSTGS